MEFTIHITKRHIEGAGLHNEYYERVVPCDEDIDIEIDDDIVERDVVNMIINDYFIVTVRKPEREVLENVLHALLSDLDCFDKAIKVYYETLRRKYEDEHDG